MSDIHQRCLKYRIETILMAKIVIALLSNRIKHNLIFAVLANLILRKNTHIIIRLRQLLGKREGELGSGIHASQIGDLAPNRRRGQ